MPKEKREGRGRKRGRHRHRPPPSGKFLFSPLLHNQTKKKRTGEEKKKEGKQRKLTVNGERDLRLHWSDAEGIAGLATEAGVVVASFGPEGVDIPRLSARRLVSVVDLDVILIPDDLRQRITSAGHAFERNVLSHPHRIAFRIARYLGRSRWIYLHVKGDYVRRNCFSSFRASRLVSFVPTLDVECNAGPLGSDECRVAGLARVIGRIVIRHGSYGQLGAGVEAFRQLGFRRRVLHLGFMSQPHAATRNE